MHFEIFPGTHVNNPSIVKGTQLKIIFILIYKSQLAPSSTPLIIAVTIFRLKGLLRLTGVVK